MKTVYQRLPRSTSVRLFISFSNEVTISFVVTALSPQLIQLHTQQNHLLHCHRSQPQLIQLHTHRVPQSSRTPSWSSSSSSSSSSSPSASVSSLTPSFPQGHGSSELSRRICPLPWNFHVYEELCQIWQSFCSERWNFLNWHAEFSKIYHIPSSTIIPSSTSSPSFNSHSYIQQHVIAEMQKASCELVFLSVKDDT